MAYRFIEKNQQIFGLRWLLRRLDIVPNAYYNYLKNRKASFRNARNHIFERIRAIYHEHGGIVGHRMMQVLLCREGIKLSKTTVHNYMNTQLDLHSIVRRKKPGYSRGTPHKIVPNHLGRDFTASKPNRKWCVDFTYLYFGNGTIRYNCTIIDLYERSVVASENGAHMTAELAIKTLRKALESTHCDPLKILLHSDQGSQFTSKEFTEFCRNAGITQSMSRAGCPCDNAPMERYYNTLKHEMLFHHVFETEKELFRAVQEFAYGWYNQIRPHSYNGNLTPFQKRFSSYLD